MSAFRGARAVDSRPDAGQPRGRLRCHQDRRGEGAFRGGCRSGSPRRRARDRFRRSHPLAGAFVSPSFGKASVVVDGDALVMEFLATGAKLKLEPWDGDVFIAR